MACSATMSAVCKLPISSLCGAITAGYTCYEGDSMSHIPTTEPSALPPSESMRRAPSLISESISPSQNPSDVPSCTPSTLDPTSGPYEAAANNLQGHVVSIHSAEENWLVVDICYSPYVYIGLVDYAVEGNYVWMDGSDVNFTNYRVDEPNSSGDEDCTRIHSASCIGVAIREVSRLDLL
eukprot:scaffold30225_cov36-Attheya_sp.AAC.1